MNDNETTKYDPAAEVARIRAEKPQPSEGEILEYALLHGLYMTMGHFLMEGRKIKALVDEYQAAVAANKPPRVTPTDLKPAPPRGIIIDRWNV